MERREHWETVYRTKDEDDVSWFQERPAMSLSLIEKCGARDAKILDVGGGASRLVDGLLDAGYTHVAVLDIAEAALAKARERLGERATGVRWIATDLLAWTPDDVFDVWHDRAVFHFMVRDEDRAAYLVTLRRALRIGGQAIIATFAENGPERCSGLPIQRWEPEALARELGPDFGLEESLREEHVTPAGKTQAFQFSRFVRIR